MTDGMTLAPRWCSYKDVEELYNLSQSTVWRMIRRGDIRASRINGGTIRIDARSLEQYLEENVMEVS